MSLANVSLVGNLVRTPELIQFSSGRVKATLVLAVNVPAKNSAGATNTKGGSANFYKIETWGRLAELASKYLSKGNQVTVAGKLYMDEWLDKNGHKRMTPRVDANQISLPPKPKSDRRDGPESESSDSEVSSDVGDYLDSDDAIGLLDGKVIDDSSK
jgi:single-strand DNA-binding protein